MNPEQLIFYQESKKSELQNLAGWMIWSSLVTDAAVQHLALENSPVAIITSS